MTTSESRDNGWMNVGPVYDGGTHRDLFMNIMRRLDDLDLNSASLTIPAASITSTMLGADSVGSVQIQADAVGSSEIAPGAVAVSELADGALTADATGRAKMAAGFFGTDTDSLAKMATGFFTATANGLAKFAAALFTADATGRGKFANLFVTDALINDVADSKITYAARTANTTFSGPISGSAAAPTFRALVTADIPLASVRTATTTPITVTAAEAAGGITIYIKLAAPGPVALALPAGVTGYTVHVKDGTGDAAANPITSTPAAGTIDGFATDTIASNLGSRTYRYTGAEWSNL